MKSMAFLLKDRATPALMKKVMSFKSTAQTMFLEEFSISFRIPITRKLPIMIFQNSRVRLFSWRELLVIFGRVDVQEQEKDRIKVIVWC